MAAKYTPKVLRDKKDENEQKNKAQTSSKTTAGTTPAVGVSKKGDSLGAASFAEYSALRRKQEEADGMKSAADRLAGQYGYKKVGNQVVFATPSSPLPKPTRENTANRAQAPGAYGIAPKDYANDMKAIGRYVNYRYDDETQGFLDKYFEGQLPDEKTFQSVFKHYARGGVETEPDVMNFHRGAELVRKATAEKEDARTAYDAAIGRLGEDAVQQLSANEGDYYKRFGNTYGAAEALNNAEPLNYKGYGTQGDMTLQEAKKYTNSPYANQGNDRFGLQRWSQTTPEERNAYQLMMEMYGQEAADNYMRDLEPELNKRLADAEVKSAEQFAQEHPFWANAKTVLTAPVRGVGAIDMGIDLLRGEKPDFYDPRLNLTREAETIREQTASNMNGVGKFAYNTGMSIADNLANMLTWGGLGSFATTLSMGGSSAASAFNSAVERGANEKQALTVAVLSGVAEGLFEKFSLDNVIEMSKGNKLGNHVVNVLKQMGIEGSEELATGIANEIADRAIMGDLSNYELLVDHYVKQGLMEDIARRKANWSSAGEIGLGALGGVVSGGVMGTGGEVIGSYRNRDVQKELEAAAKALTEAEKQQEEASPVPVAVEPVSAEEKQREALVQEYENEARERELAREERENAREYKQEEQQQAEKAEDEAEQAQEESPAKTPENAENEQTFDNARNAKVTDEDGNEHSVSVIGVYSVEDGYPILKVKDENGEDDSYMASDLQFEGPEGELLASKGVERMDAKGVRNYLQNYDAENATPEQYAQAYNEVYQRANAGLSYEDAAVRNQNARTYLTEDARLAAYAAGLNAYNQTHERVQPAAVGQAKGETSGNVQLSAKDVAAKGRVSRQFTQEAYRNLGKKGQKKVLAQMELLNAIASRTGRRIVLVDNITGKDGKKANALYDTETGEIRVALNATENAYAYAAMHELTHAVKNEHGQEWDGFVKFVRDGLARNKQNWDSLVEYQMKQFGYSREVAEEEVICNTVPALLQDESNVLKLYKNNRKLFDRVVDWVKSLLNDVKAAGKALSGRSKSWEQMDALANDRELLQGMYDRLMKVMEKPVESNAKSEQIKFSMQDSEGNDLTDEQQEYFAESKVRDEEGRLMVMYHGTPSGNYEKFKSATYFTPMEWYADVYQNPSASSISYGKKHDAPTTFEAYLNITKPFDTRKPKERKIFQQEYYRQWGTGAPLSESGLPDWTDGMDLQEFIEEMGYDYDGLILDEGGVPDDNGGVKSRGLSYVIFDPAQAKLVDNKTPTEDERFRYSMSDVDENVREAVDAQQKAFELVKGHRITAAEADKLAGAVLKAANSDYDRQKLAAEISRIYDFVERGEDVDMRQVEDEMTELMARVMAKSKALDMEHEEMAKPIREYLRETAIAMTETQRKEAASLAGSYGAYRRGLFGRVRLSNLGRVKLDSAWQELNEMNAELFPADAREGDMPALLQSAVDALKPVYSTGMGFGEEESANWLAGKMNEAYFALPAVKAAATEAKAFTQSVDAMNKAMKRFEETSWSEYQNALKSIEQARGETAKTQKQKETAAMRKKYKDWRDRDTAQRKERELKAKYRVKIERTANTLMNWMQKPTDAKHVPAGVEDSLRRMLEALDFSGKTTKTAEDLSARINGLADALLHAQEGEDENRTIFLERDQQMIDELRRMAELIRGNAEHNQREGRGVYELNGLELRELSKWLDVVRHVVTEASKLRGSNLPGESVEQVAAMSMQEMSQKKALKDRKWVGQQLHEYFGPDMWDSFSFFERLGPTANAIFMELRRGFDKATELTRKAEEHTKTILDGAKLNEITGKKAAKQTFHLSSGGTVEMTKANIMELYVLSRREQAQSHLYGDGIKIDGDKEAHAHALTKADVKAITDTLTADEKRIAEGMQKFLSKECASWGNETSVKLLGYKKFGEEYYWPIRTDSNTRNTTKLEENYAANISAIKNQGMTKQTIEGASNAIVIGDIFNTYTKHISNMAAYSAYALPLSDFTRWYNSRGVKTEIEQMLGKKGLQYINNFLMAVNGSSLQADQGGLERLTGKMTRNAKIASVGANARVVIQQPTSYARAAMYISPKYLSLALGMRTRDMDLINKYCGIAQWKSWGFYETNIGPNLRQMIVGDESAANKIREAATWMAAKGDEWTLKHLWNACELETQELYPGLKQGSSEYFQQVGQRMSELVDRTQVVDSVFHRSQLMRSKSGTAQMLTNFMSEPTKTYNMLMSAINDYAENRKNKAARNRVARAFAVYAVTGVLTAAAAAVVDAFRDDDDEKDWLEKYVGAVGGNTVENLNPLGMLPVVKDVISLMQGYEPSRMDTQSIQRIIWAAQEVRKYAEGTSKQNLYGVSYKIAQAASSTLGIPFGNWMRDVNAIVKTATGTDITKTPEARKNSTVIRMYNAMMEGNKAEAKKLREQLQIKAKLTPKEIDTKVAELLMEEPTIADAWAAKSAKNYAEMNRIKNQLTSKGISGEAVDKAIVRYGEKQEPKKEKTKDPGEQLSVTLYSEEDVVSAMRTVAGLEKGTATEADVRAMISERVAASKAKDPDKSVKGDIQSELKKDYLAMEEKGNTAAMRKLAMVMKNVLGTDEDTMTSWVKDRHAEQLREAVDGYNSGNAAKAVAKMRADGKTDSQIKSSLSKYKQIYIDAMKRGDKVTANKIKRMLQSLGLRSTKNKDLYSDAEFEKWLK